VPKAFGVSASWAMQKMNPSPVILLKTCLQVRTEAIFSGFLGPVTPARRLKSGGFKK
jgi:hypothetical protein